MKAQHAVLVVVCLGALVLGTGVASGQLSGSIVGWGYNYNGQCDVPEPNADFVALATGWYHSLGVKSDGTVVAWGRNDEGQCDVPEPNADFVAVAAGGALDVFDIPPYSAIFGHSLGLKSDGTIVAWGSNNEGQCSVPAPNADFVAVAAGPAHNLGLRSDGTVAAWGENYHGACDVPEPNSDFVAVAADGFFGGGDPGFTFGHSLGLKSDGTIVAWGSNGSGQCDVPAPNADFVAIAGAGQRSLGLKSDGTIVVWGWNSFGLCEAPDPNTDFVAVAGGNYHTLGLKFYGSIVGFPRHHGGVPYVSPVPPRGGFVAIVASGNHSLGLRAIPKLATPLRARSVSVPGEPAFGIRHVMPNPVTAHASIGYSLPGGWRSARLSVHDVAGRLVRRLDPATGTQGFVEVDWDGRASSGERVASGVYFVRLEVDGAVATQRMVLLR